MFLNEKKLLMILIKSQIKKNQILKLLSLWSYFANSFFVTNDQQGQKVRNFFNFQPFKNNQKTKNKNF